MPHRNPESRSRFRRLWLVLSILSATAIQAASPAELVITQAVATGTEITAYIAVRDESGAPLTELDPTRLQATIGAHTATVDEAAPFAATGEGVLTLLLVDVSRSLDAARFARLRQALRTWIDALGEHDQAALITFGAQVQTRVPPTADRAALNAAIDQLAPTDDRTALHQALATALTLGRQRAEGLPRRRAILILSDGLDDAPGGMSADEVLARLDEGSVPILAIGFGQTRDRAQREAGLANLGRLARRTGGFLIDATAGNDPGAAYAAMRERLHAVTRISLQCADCIADGRRQRLRIGLTTPAGLTLDDGMDVRLYPVSAPEPEPTTPPAEISEPDTEIVPDTPPEPPTAPVETPADIPLDGLARWWPYATAAGLTLALLLVLLWRARAKSRAAQRLDPTSAAEPSPEPLSALVLDPPPIPKSPAKPQPPSGPAIQVAFMNGPRRGQSVRLVLSPAALFGRAPGGAAGTSLAIPEDDEVSARHARVSLSGRTLILEDLGSTNGSWLNGVPLSAPHPVREGDVLRFGQTELRLTGVQGL
ncbi:VWA domain-containing protein [Allochromatium palmeri]|uniref:VWA domain-containing protein n=1 Tax=Allochromatium palmeri TaxID=231048 RepID=A0A6N8ED99_9GAMM|nr:VWA domain-containing protein [Allochromatium palmeri]MTW20566.1 VWA domain-containing protein [Allochromatium palmeri]